MTRIAALLFVALAAAACGGPLEPAAATVYGRDITMARIRAELEKFTSTPAYRQQAEQGDPQSIERGFEQVTLARLIRRAVLEPKAQELGIEITDDDVTARIDDFRAQRDLTNDAAFEEFLKEQGINPEQLRELAYDALLRRFRSDDDPRAASITPEDFELRPERLERALDVVAFCRLP